ncbi:MAG TPA: thiamine phosphate synthase [Polyangia bacterium]
MPALAIAGYYAILDVRAPAHPAPGVGPGILPAVQVAAELERVGQLLAAGPCCLQLRGKNVADGALLSLARQVAGLAHAAGVPFCLNDRPDLGFLAGADVVHVGQEDLSIAEVRAVQRALGRVTPIGVSTHNLAQAQAAVAAGADYIGFGPVFATSSKVRPDPVVGLAALAEVCRTVTVPVVAIGGISRARIAGVVETGAAAAAVIGDVDQAADRTAAGREIGRAFEASAFGAKRTSHV